MSHNVNLQHIIFRTYRSYPAIPQENKREVLAYINAVSESMNVKVLRLNAHKNHVHVFVDLPADLELAKYVQKIKSNSSKAFNRHPHFPNFVGWNKKYGSFSISRWDKNKIINYVKEQDEHHRFKSFREELIELFGEDVLSDKYWRRDWLDEEIEDNNKVMPPALIVLYI